MRAFEAAARLGRMNAAATELSVTPGAISRQVRQLEDSLDVRLFEGSKNKPTLTRAGQTLLPTLSDALDSIDAAIRNLREGDGGILDVACFSTFTVKWLIPRLFDFNARHPAIEIRLRTTGLGGTARSACDLAITAEPASPAASADVLPLFPEQLGPVLAPSLATRTILRTPEDLAQHTLLQSKARPDVWQMWASAMACTEPKPNGPMFEHYYFTLEAAVAGLGVCMAPWHLVADDVHAGRLLAPLGFRPSGYHYVAQRQTQRNPRLDTFCTWLQAQAAGSPLPPV
jgi:LysR family transcriptional regulator, glycine cleavage system transcriptional activator